MDGEFERKMNEDVCGLPLSINEQYKTIKNQKEYVVGTIEQRHEGKKSKRKRKKLIFI